MKTPLIVPALFLLVLTFSFCNTAQNTVQKTDSTLTKTKAEKNIIPDSLANTIYYSFDRGFINLETLKGVADNLPHPDFKNFSKFRFRFNDPTAGDTVIYKGATFYVSRDFTLIIKHGLAKKRISLPPPHVFVDDPPYYLLKVMDDGVVLYISDNLSVYTINKYDENGNVIFASEIRKKRKPYDGAIEYEEGPVFRGFTQHEFIFSGYVFDPNQNTTIVDLSNGKQTTHELRFGGIIKDENEEYLAGLVEMSDSVFRVKMFSTGKIFTIIPKFKQQSICETILSGNKLVIAYYCPISEGCFLCCINLETGKTEWDADVKQVSVVHSGYSNRVFLSLYKNKILLEGNEDGGNSFQVFDLNSGKRLAGFGATEMGIFEGH